MRNRKIVVYFSWLRFSGVIARGKLRRGAGGRKMRGSAETTERQQVGKSVTMKEGLEYDVAAGAIAAASAGSKEV